MVAKRRQRRKYTWLPTLGSTQINSETTEDDSYGYSVTIDVPEDGSQVLAILPVIPDAPRASAAGALVEQGNSLEDLIGNEWMLERIVGKIDLAYGANVGSLGTALWVPNAMIGAGYFVARADHSDPNVPIGDTADINEDYNPLNMHSVREPWLWHRTWTFGMQGLAGAALPNANSAFPNQPRFHSTTTESLPGATNGNLVDTASVRRIGQDDRLFLAIGGQAQMFGQTGIPTEPGVIFATVYVRVLGRLLRAKNDGKF